MLLSPLKKLSSESWEKYAQIKHCLSSKTVHNQICGWFWCDKRGWTFSLEESILRIMDLYFGKMRWFEVKKPWWCLWCSFSLYKTWLTDGLERCGWFVDYCDVFISCLDSHSDGTHSLQWASDVMQHFSKSVLMKKQTHLHLIWPEGEYISSKSSFFGWTNPLIKINDVLHTWWSVAGQLVFEQNHSHRLLQILQLSLDLHRPTHTHWLQQDQGANKPEKRGQRSYGTHWLQISSLLLLFLCVDDLKLYL